MIVGGAISVWAPSDGCPFADAQACELCHSSHHTAAPRPSKDFSHGFLFLLSGPLGNAKLSGQFHYDRLKSWHQDWIIAAGKNDGQACRFTDDTTKRIGHKTGHIHRRAPS